MQRPSFGVVSGVVGVLAALAFLSHMLSGLIPAGPLNRLGSETAEFLVQAAHQEIDWRPLSESTFAEARKQELPIMLVVGSACSATGRALDRVVFTSKDIRSFLGRNFICVRVDTMQMPEYVNAFLPISRAISQNGARLAIPPDLQVWFLDRKGRMYGYAAETAIGQSLDPKVFLSRLQEAADRFASIQDGKFQAGTDQLRDLRAVEGDLIPAVPDLVRYALDLQSATSSDYGGFPANGLQRLWPCAWRFQLIGMRLQDYERSISPCLTSPMVDLLDGGFFTDPATANWMGVGYDRLAVTNAAMLQTLSLGALLTRDPLQKWLALRTFDTLASSFVDQGFISAGSVGDEGELRRSARYSFSPRRLRDVFPDGSDREWVRANLGLRVETNPLMTPRLTSADLPFRQGDLLEDALQKMRKGSSEPALVGKCQLDVGGYATARLLEAARILADPQRLALAKGLYEDLDQFRSFDDVVHSLVTDPHVHVYLGDYLAYADAALQYYLATGSAPALRRGLAVLKRGLFLFAGRASGEYLLSQASQAPLNPQDMSSPEIVDNQRESCTAQVIRLCDAYAKLLGPSEASLRRAAGDALARFAPFAMGMGQFAGGYFCAAADMEDPRYAVTVGPDALSLAAKLATLAPTRLVAPASSAVKAPRQAPGVYVIRENEALGPMSPVEAAKQLARAGY